MSSIRDCADGLKPALNTDISGIGVRLAIYLQTLLLGWLNVFGYERGETESADANGALNTLVVTNCSLILAAFIQGYSSRRDMILQDAIVVFYFLVLIWGAASLSLLALSPSKLGIVRLVLYVAQTIAAYAFALRLFFVDGSKFGSSLECNQLAVFFIFRTTVASDSGMLAVRVGVPVVFLSWAIVMSLHIPRIIGRIKSAYIWFILITAMWGLIVFNTEVLIKENYSLQSQKEPWDFSQISVMFLVIIPFQDFIQKVLYPSVREELLKQSRSTAELLARFVGGLNDSRPTIQGKHRRCRNPMLPSFCLPVKDEDQLSARECRPSSTRRSRVFTLSDVLKYLTVRSQRNADEAESYMNDSAPQTPWPNASPDWAKAEDGRVEPSSCKSALTDGSESLSFTSPNSPDIAVVPQGASSYIVDTGQPLRPATPPWSASNEVHPASPSTGNVVSPLQPAGEDELGDGAPPSVDPSQIFMEEHATAAAAYAALQTDSDSEIAALLEHASVPSDTPPQSDTATRTGRPADLSVGHSPQRSRTALETQSTLIDRAQLASPRKAYTFDTV